MSVENNYVAYFLNFFSSRQMRAIWIALFALLLIGGTILFSGNRREHIREGEKQPPASLSPIVIKITDEGFEPANIRILKGVMVKFQNKGVRSHWPASNLHPTHGIYPEFDPKRALSPGEEWDFVFLKAGKWRYHDHLFPNVRGEVVVEE